jgi:DNA-binding GntR family transcriptional regulator
MQTIFYPMDLPQRNAAAPCLLVAESIDEGMTAFLRGHLGINQVGGAMRSPRGRLAGIERTFFDLSDKVQVAILEHRRTGYNEDRRPIRFTVAVYPADRNQLELEPGHVPSEH